MKKRIFALLTAVFLVLLAVPLSVCADADDDYKQHKDELIANIQKNQAERQKHFDRGFDSGYDSGYEVGYADGFTDGATETENQLRAASKSTQSIILLAVAIPVIVILAYLVVNHWDKQGIARAKKDGLPIPKTSMALNILQCILVTMCYWFVLFIGPAIVLLWNNFSYYVSGLGYGTESLMYKVLTFFSQPIACILALPIANGVGKLRHPLCLLSNAIIASAFCGVLCFSYILSGNYGVELWAILVSMIVCIGTAVYQVWEFGEEYRELEKELERCKKIAPQSPGSPQPYHRAISVLELISKKNGVSISDIAETLYVSLRRADGRTESQARQELEKWLSDHPD